MSKVLIEYNPESGAIIQTAKSANFSALVKVWEDHNKVFGVFDASEMPNIGLFKILDGEIVPLSDEEMKPSETELLAEQYYEIESKREASQPKPIHATKLAIALSGSLEMLKAEADLKGVSVEELADIIIGKAEETMALESEYQAKSFSLQQNN